MNAFNSSTAAAKKYSAPTDRSTQKQQPKQQQQQPRTGSPSLHLSVAAAAAAAAEVRLQQEQAIMPAGTRQTAGGGGAAGGTGPSSEDLSTAASVLTSISNSMPVAYTPTTHRVSKAKKGKKVHVCEFGCGKVFSRAEHRRRHEANHREEPLYRCSEPGCDKTFQRPDLLHRHLERQHHYRASAQNAHTELGTSVNADGAEHLAAEAAKFAGATNSPTVNDFDAYGDEIRELYLRQQRSLRDIKAYMETKHGFAPLDDHVYEEAFGRLCLNKGNSPVPTASMTLPMGGTGIRPEWDSAEADLARHAMGHYDGARAQHLGEQLKVDAMSNRIPLDPLLGQHDCPAPYCDRRGTEGFASREELWDHMVASHSMNQNSR